MKILITGITGFAGSHLAEFALRQPGTEVYGTVRTRSRLGNIESFRPQINLLDCDLKDPFAVKRLIRRVRPEWIFHLAAQSFVPSSWEAPWETLTNNILCQLNILEAVREEGLPARIQAACSSEEYGIVYPEEIPITEENPLRPVSPYGVSKVAQDLLAYQYFVSYATDTVRTRAFNHTGPKRGEGFVTSNFARQIAEIEKGLREPVIYTGNLEAVRDFTDVRDMVKGYWAALEKGEPGAVYVLASGRGYTIREVLEIMLQKTKVKVKIKTDPARLRPSDVPVLLGNADKFNKLTGWQASIPLEQTLEDLLNYWRSQLKII